MNIVFVKHGKKNKRYAFEVPCENGTHAPLAPVVSIIPRDVVRHVQERMLVDIDAMVRAHDLYDAIEGCMHCCELEG